MDYNIEKIIEQARKGNTDQLLENIPAADAQRIKDIIGNKEAREKLLSSPQAQKILEMLKRGGI